MSTDPESAIQLLEADFGKGPSGRGLESRHARSVFDTLQSALREAARRKVEFEQTRQQRQENVAAARERLLVQEGLLHNQEKTKQLMARFNSLMAEGKFRSAEDPVAAEAEKLAPGNPVPLLAKI